MLLVFTLKMAFALPVLYHFVAADNLARGMRFLGFEHTTMANVDFAWTAELDAAEFSNWGAPSRCSAATRAGRSRCSAGSTRPRRSSSRSCCGASSSGGCGASRPARCGARACVGGRARVGARDQVVPGRAVRRHRGGGAPVPSPEFAGELTPAAARPAQLLARASSSPTCRARPTRALRAAAGALLEDAVAAALASRAGLPAAGGAHGPGRGGESLAQRAARAATRSAPRRRARARGRRRCTTRSSRARCGSRSRAPRPPGRDAAAPAARARGRARARGGACAGSARRAAQLQARTTTSTAPLLCADAPELGDLVWRNLDTAGWGSSRRHRRWLNLVFGALMTMTWACVGLMYVQRAYCYHGSCKCCTNTHKWNSCAREYSYDDVVNYSVDTNLGRSWNTVRKCWCAQLTRAEARAPENWQSNIRWRTACVLGVAVLRARDAHEPDRAARDAPGDARAALRLAPRATWLLFGTFGTLLMNAVGVLLITYLRPLDLKMPSKDAIEADCNLNLGTDKFPVYILDPYVPRSREPRCRASSARGSRFPRSTSAACARAVLRELLVRRRGRAAVNVDTLAQRTLALFVTFTVLTFDSGAPLLDLGAMCPLRRDARVRQRHRAARARARGRRRARARRRGRRRARRAPRSSAAAARRARRAAARAGRAASCARAGRPRARRADALKLEGGRARRPSRSSRTCCRGRARAPRLMIMSCSRALGRRSSRWST